MGKVGDNQHVIAILPYLRPTIRARYGVVAGVCRHDVIPTTN